MAEQGWLRNMFGSQNNINQGGPAQSPQNNQQQQQGQQGNPNNTPNNTSNDPNNRQTPFDAYKDLWKDVSNKDATPPPFELSDEVVSKSADQLDFLRDYDPNEIQALRDHFGDKADSVFKLVNTVGRKAYANSMKHAAAVTNKYMDVRRPYDNKATGSQVREHMVDASIDSFEVAQQNPFVKQQLTEVARRLARQHPDATPDWIKGKTKEYFDHMSQAFNPTVNKEQQEAENQKRPGGVDYDWDSFLSSGQQQQPQKSDFAL